MKLCDAVPCACVRSFARRVALRAASRCGLSCGVATRRSDVVVVCDVVWCTMTLCVAVRCRVQLRWCVLLCDGVLVCGAVLCCVLH